MKRCGYCACAGPPVLQPAWLAWLAGLVWLLPLGFLARGLWPFFLLPAIAVTAWAVGAVHRVCRCCGRPWRPAGRQA